MSIPAKDETILNLDISSIKLNNSKRIKSKSNSTTTLNKEGILFDAEQKIPFGDNTKEESKIESLPTFESKITDFYTQTSQSPPKI